MSTLRVNTIQNSGGTGSPAINGLAAAWVNFNGTGTVAIRASSNVSSITDNGAGNYNINFTTAMPNENYSAVAAGGLAEDNNAYAIPSVAVYQTGLVQVRLVRTSTTVTLNDSALISVAIFR